MRVEGLQDIARNQTVVDPSVLVLVELRKLVLPYVHHDGGVSDIVSRRERVGGGECGGCEVVLLATISGQAWFRVELVMVMTWGGVWPENTNLARLFHGTRPGAGSAVKLLQHSRMIKRASLEHIDRFDYILQDQVDRFLVRMEAIARSRVILQENHLPAPEHDLRLSWLDAFSIAT